MSASRRTAHCKVGQPENTLEMLTTPDIEAPVTSQNTGSKAKGKGHQHAAPKAKAALKSAAAVLHAPEIDMDVELEPPGYTQSTPNDQQSSKGPSAQVVEPVKKKGKLTLQPAPENLRTKKKKKIQVPPRSPLPQRINHVIHPGKPAMPRPKRTSAEVAEAKAKKTDLLERLEELDKQRKIALAEMELDEEEEEIEEERTAVRYLQDAGREQVIPSDAEDDGLESFPMDEDEPLVFPDDSDEDEPLDTEDDYPKPESVKNKPVPVSVLNIKAFITNQSTKKKKKAARGETREAVEAEKARLRQERQNLKRPAEDNKG